VDNTYKTNAEGATLHIAAVFYSALALLTLAAGLYGIIYVSQLLLTAAEQNARLTGFLL
jgi:hypothetical protein